jgi:DNA-directed RNA polymerase subunit N
MIINIRCITCGKVLADKWEYYKKKVAELEKKSIHKNFDGIQTKEILDELGLHRYCCRRIFLGHVDLIDEI